MLSSKLDAQKEDTADLKRQVATLSTDHRAQQQRINSLEADKRELTTQLQASHVKLLDAQSRQRTTEREARGLERERAKLAAAVE